MYVKSTAIQVFPTTKRRVENKIFSELTTTRLITELFDKEGFIVKYDDTNLSDIKLIFNIKGYYFEIDSFNTILANITGDKVYANIVIDDSSEEFPELYGSDTGRTESGYTPESEYEGVDFSPNKTGDYYLLIANKENNSWKVNQDSLIKFVSKSIGNVDGGEI